MCILSIHTGDSDHAVVELSGNGLVIRKVGEARTLKSQTVLPLIEAVLEEKGIKLTDLTAVTLYTGPGSYTGLRVGAAIAQTLALLLDIPLNNEPPATPIQLVYEAISNVATF